jgi:hypothetical protein
LNPRTGTREGSPNITREGECSDVRSGTGTDTRSAARAGTRRGKRRAFPLRAAVGAALLAFFVLAGLFVAATIPHPSGAGARLHPPQARAQSAENLEHAVIDQLTQPRPAAAGLAAGEYRSEAWSVSIMEADVNAWLGSRMGDWAASRGVNIGASMPTRMKIDEAGAHVWVPWRGVWGFTVSLTLDAPAVDGAPVRVAVRSARLGLLPVPMTLVRPVLGAASEQAWARELASGGVLTLTKRELSMEDGRRVRLVSAALRPGRVEVTCITEKLAAKPAP